MGRTSRRRQPSPGALASRQEVVERAEDYVRAHVDAPVPLSTLCSIVGLSERALRNAFYSVRGKSPKRSILAERLEGVRRALSDAGTRPTTVTGVATNYGFSELGRVAASYREAFGEMPSETLRGTGRKSVPERMSNMKGHADVCTG
jgi:AraC family ethanolamine operon transcriptional activator